MAKNKADKYLSGGIKKRETEEAPQELLDLLDVQRSEPERLQEVKVEKKANVSYRHAYDINYDNTSSTYVLVTLKYEVTTGEIVEKKEEKLSDNKLKVIGTIRDLFQNKIMNKRDI